MKASALLFFSLCLLFTGFARAEIVDRIVAVVNDEVITLTDVDISYRFGLFEDLQGSQGDETRRRILDRMIDQKLVVQLASESVSVGEEELEMSLSDVVQRTDPDIAGAALLQFGLDWDDLKSYLREKLSFQKVISQRFSRRIIVSIDEIEKHYEQVYVPSQREKNLSPQPMIEVLDQIERDLRREKVEDQVREWIDNLKRQANIQIKYHDIEDERWGN